MSDTLVVVEKVSKKFCRTLKRSLWYGVNDLAYEMIGSKKGHLSLRPDEFWALNDVSFSLERGEALGLIGHNGAGKTTLLRMLNGLIRPDSGRIEIVGRMQALIALGAGFNPVLTGRENIYVNGAILGISRTEISRRFDEIVSFSGIEEFIDMPVQSYSSGMTVRLGFSVAAHLEPDVLLVDEVLAVGDLAFRTKCQVRIQELKQSGVVIIFVSHNLHAVSHICSRAITLERGRVIYDGSTEQAIDTYRLSLLKSNENINDVLRPGTREIRIQNVEILNDVDEPQEEFQIGDPVKIRLHYRADEEVINPVFNVAMSILYSETVTGIRTDVDGLQSGRIRGEGFVDVIIPNLYLLPNVYTIDGVIFHRDGYTYYDRMNKAAHFKISGGLQVNGSAYLPHSWQFENHNGTGTIVAEKSLVGRPAEE